MRLYVLFVVWCAGQGAGRRVAGGEPSRLSRAGAVEDMSCVLGAGLVRRALSRPVADLLVIVRCCMWYSMALQTFPSDSAAAEKNRTSL
jgi:hypothetical protein